MAQSRPMDSLDVVLEFVRAVEGGARGEELARWLDPTVVQVELPNRISPAGARRDRAAMQAASERGAQLLASQRYEVKGSVVQGDRVVLELDWTGTLAIPVGNVPAGGSLRAHIAMFFEVREGRIVALRNYDCYEPF